MIGLSDVARREIDDTLDLALGRLRARSAALGDASAALGEATAAGASGGKRLRPALVVAAFEAFGGDIARAPGLWRVAAAFELLHAAFVVHDDLIDGDVERRGIPNVVGRFRDRARARGGNEDEAQLLGTAAAVLAGDLLLFEATRLIATAPVTAPQRAALFVLLDDALLVSAAGELADVEQTIGADLPPAASLLRTARDKTAFYSFQAPLAAGALLAGASEDERSALEAAGSEIGVAFQLADDLIGTFGTRDEAGREPGADLRASKRTPLIAMAAETEAWPQVANALALAPTGPIAIAEAQRELAASGARERTVALISHTLRSARTRAADAALPRDAVVLLAALAAAVEDRIPR
ncbi:polyprenyl synthetase family protein [Microbacterium sp. EYE_5]|uniref:polyprenyl synthetase family protein n=1 Tax=unclassified Microbacterium TaxID=2609290 RepID=UPI002004B423|nr:MULTISPECIES: polyprenyl synthetase family protein [unclassified Microbacterium]MCK6081008.1 polyprenyl synthetase family protein [Microbacterium sp. EYE_382]MCK6086278.1 polyprenyl synthetase family protein [Microbacterium sp. EYE_384]MCK6124224.1 polyprenyl synthetase family protein [Microbacterium sp. EYE_80]MCK6127133.1 polyprenyl synthetase family protein [Microbacterium sp. EYE_79]MCK6141963.1 polyprenyl synthetase family protein [Microbacterium sp. EYE_39]